MADGGASHTAVSPLRAEDAEPRVECACERVRSETAVFAGGGAHATYAPVPMMYGPNETRNPNPEDPRDPDPMGGPLPGAVGSALGPFPVRGEVRAATRWASTGRGPSIRP
ncbi:unnamed protein product [Merluccius merluccius]